MNSSQVTNHMFNPFDGANFLTGTVLLSAFGFIVGTNPLLLLAAPIITGLFMLLCKGVELYVRYRTDKCIQQLNQRLERAEAQLQARLRTETRSGK